MPYIAVLDYEHLDNGLFLNAFAKSLAQHENPGIIIHADSKYTDRIIQTGVMRADARIRAMKDLNHRLIALLADQGVAAIGLNGYQKGLIRISEDERLEVNVEQFRSLPPQPALVISALAETESGNQPQPVPLARFADSLQTALEIDEILIFSAKENSEVIKQHLPDKASWDKTDRAFLNEQLPEEFLNSGLKLRLTTAGSFAKYPDLAESTLIF